MEKKYNYFYRITNKINNHYYYGVHSTNDLNDGYMGSGKRLPIVYKKYGIENFSKEILKYFETRKEALEYESEAVTESLVNDIKCYNLITGGGYLDTGGKVCVLDETTDKYIFIGSDEYHKHKDEYKTPCEGVVYVKCDAGNKYHRISVDEYNCNKEKYITPTNGVVSVRDKLGNIYCVSTNDERYKNGELKFFWAGRHHTDKAKQKMSETHKANKNQKGEKNSQFGKCWVTKNGVNKSIPKNELDKYFSDGWVKGRKLILQNDKISKFNKEEIVKLRNSGLTWIEIAKKMCVSENTIYKFKKKYIDIK